MNDECGVPGSTRWTATAEDQAAAQHGHLAAERRHAEEQQTSTHWASQGDE
jgi:hypothetical protein